MVPVNTYTFLILRSVKIFLKCLKMPTAKATHDDLAISEAALCTNIQPGQEAHSQVSQNRELSVCCLLSPLPLNSEIIQELLAYWVAGLYFYLGNCFIGIFSCTWKET